ncbi:hypothetical protein [Crateriforma conspicua]|uniref:Uncharacterized protein n=1 Tax=Crateriforma conspicua TaxID=2527996 RepID=A0A5C5Y455_9PLAN|nr:hypothetical protein [Crateriforma conspicua]TWT69075.1 hypothetical protein Pan14r_13590 [Crateriforma conspicua]
MRLTLRTLLAYLDSTLDPQDSEALKQKVQESAFAAELVRRIRACTADPKLSAPSPEAIGPINDANVIAEYLDSTLTPEQIAETERFCLESDQHLAEAAACHQILTIALAQKATVDPDLRAHVLGLPDQVDASAATAFSVSQVPPVTSFSDVDVPAMAGATSSGDQESLESVGAAGPDDPTLDAVPPVGPDDSGVRTAVTRIRDNTPPGTASANAPSAMAGAKPRPIGRDFYSGTVRPSRITPWLVTLGLAAVFLFVFSKAFEPVLNRETAMQDTDAEVDAESDSLPIAGPAAEPTQSEDSATESEAELDTDTDAERATDEAGDDATGDEAEPETTSPMTTDDAPSVAETPNDDSATSPSDADSSTTETAASDSASSESGYEMSDSAATPESPIAGPADPVMAATDDATNPNPQNTLATDLPADESSVMADSDASGTPADPAALTEMSDDSTDSLAEDAAPAEDTELPGPVVANESELLVAVSGESTELLKRGDVLAVGDDLIAAPLYRPAILTRDELTVRVIGPAEIRIADPPLGEDPSAVSPETIELQRGGLLVTTAEANGRFTFVSGEFRVQVDAPEPETTFAIRRRFQRPPGALPLDPDSVSRSIEVTSLVGPIEITTEKAVLTDSTPEESIETDDAEGDGAEDGDVDPGDVNSSDDEQADAPEEADLAETEPAAERQWGEVGQTEQIVEGAQWLVDSAGKTKVQAPTEKPGWFTLEDESLTAVQQSARDGLLALIEPENDLILELREALDFRRSEVGALAGQTLLALGQPDVFFGSAGLLNRPRQRLHWQSHFEALLDYVNTSPEHAQAVFDAIGRMEMADQPILTELLIGLTNKQLAAGADAGLVGNLDSPSMSVRVLAVENLRQITGTTAYFNAAETNQSKRQNDLKKWQIRVRKGDIRYPDSP